MCQHYQFKKRSRSHPVYMSLKKSHKSYPQVFKDEAVLMVLEQVYSVADAANHVRLNWYPYEYR
ncbi:hypothetical protein L5L55_08100 [Shewanella glacialipiscicola]|uniref:hypothetical protein n=1 Tax=Shewanella glacialipiscicola TaxID=614069 RepID=UPI0021DAF857|nr:hypothetical protein [Shewanella glacialipiscicola]MCU7994721.1 hypothetical protein [Shewanella glacialipiscicola]MCU8026192.1 hypothetical protein [Shewanella glacialipiscicola]